MHFRGRTLAMPHCFLWPELPLAAMALLSIIRLRKNFRTIELGLYRFIFDQIARHVVNKERVAANLSAVRRSCIGQSQQDG